MEKNSINTTDKVAVASRSFSRHLDLRRKILSKYTQVTFNESGRSLSGLELIEFLKGHDKAITALEVIDETILSKLPELKVIGKYGVGLDMIDLEAMERFGVKLGWTGGVNKRSVAEIVIAAAISLLHRTSESHLEVRNGQWRQLMGRQLTGKTVGIIGCGNIGKEVAILLKPFDCKILVYDIKNYIDFYLANQITPHTLEFVLAESDIVTIHLPLDDSTKGMFNFERINLMKKGSYIINIARGGIIDEKSLKQHLLNGHLGGAALDVFSEEPPTDSELIRLSNVISTGHIGGSTEEAVVAMGLAAINGLETAKNAKYYFKD